MTELWHVVCVNKASNVLFLTQIRHKLVLDIKQMYDLQVFCMDNGELKEICLFGEMRAETKIVEKRDRSVRHNGYFFRQY